MNAVTTTPHCSSVSTANADASPSVPWRAVFARLVAGCDFPVFIRISSGAPWRRAIDRGMPVEQVQKLLGHVTIDTTMQYALVSQSNVKASHRKYLG